MLSLCYFTRLRRWKKLGRGKEGTAWSDGTDTVDGFSGAWKWIDRRVKEREIFRLSEPISRLSFFFIDIRRVFFLLIACIWCRVKFAKNTSSNIVWLFVLIIRFINKFVTAYTSFLTLARV